MKFWSVELSSPKLCLTIRSLRSSPDAATIPSLIIPVMSWRLLMFVILKLVWMFHTENPMKS